MSVEVIVSKVNWKAVQDGLMDKLQFYREGQLHYVFGDNPWAHVVRLRVEEIDGGPGKERVNGGQ